MKHSLESPSVPMTAMPLGTSGSSISERITRNAPPSAHEKDVRPWSILPGSIGWDPTVDQSPIRKARGCSAGFGMEASCAIEGFMGWFQEVVGQGGQRKRVIA